MNRYIRTAGILALATIIAGLWLFLYWRAQAVNLLGQSEVLSILRDLKEVDTRWNDRLIGLRLVPGAQTGDAAAPVAPSTLALTQHRLHVQAQSLSNPLLNQSIEALKDAFRAKATAVEKYVAANRATQETASRVRQGSDALQAALRVDQQRQIGRVSLAVIGYLGHPSLGSARLVGEATGAVDVNSVAEPQRSALAEVVQRARLIIEQKDLEDRLFRDAVYASTGPRIDTITRTFDTEFQRAIDESEQYRLYLLLYSALLIALLGIVGSRLMASYKTINRMNRQLREANEGLELRVAERTSELSTAMLRLKESEAMLVQSEKMSSLGQMVAGVAHEVNTPLAYVKSSLDSVDTLLPRIRDLEFETNRLLEYLQADNPDEKLLTEQFGIVNRMLAELRDQHTLGDLSSLVTDGIHGIAQISELVTNLRNFARLDRSKIAEFDLNEGVRGAIAIARNAIKAKRVQTALGTVPRIACSPSQINQVILNLLTNSAQATRDNGTIAIRTGARGPDHVYFEVEDNGHGIPEDVVPKIFDPFFTTKDVGKGTGLGLSIAYKIVEQHGGRIEVVSKVNVGTRFTVTLPIRAATALTQGRLAAAA